MCGTNLSVGKQICVAASAGGDALHINDRKKFFLSLLQSCLSLRTVYQQLLYQARMGRPAMWWTVNTTARAVKVEQSVRSQIGKIDPYICYALSSEVCFSHLSREACKILS